MVGKYRNPPPFSKLRTIALETLSFTVYFKPSCGDIYRPYTHCGRRQFMLLRSAHCRRDEFFTLHILQQRQYVPKCAMYSVAPVYNTLRGFLGRLYTERERKREKEREREREYIIILINSRYLNSMFVFIQMQTDRQDMIITR